MKADTYRAILAACFRELPIRSVELAAEGWDSQALMVNGELIFRFPKRSDVEPQYRMEARLLPLLAERVSLPIPRFAYVWDARPPYPRAFAGYRMLAGQQLRAGMLASLDAERLAEQLGRFLAELHAFPVEQAAGCGVSDHDAAGWRAAYRELYAKIEARVFPLLTDAARGPLARRWREYLEDDACFQFRPALIHRDLSGDHILVDQSQNTIAGVIDWGDAAIGDPAIDFAGLLDDFGEAFARRALARYDRPVDPTFWRRVELYHFVVPFHEVLFGLDTGQPRHVEQGLNQLGLR